MLNTKYGLSSSPEIDAIAAALGGIDRGISSGDKWVDETGGHVTSLTEAIMGVTSGLCRIAAAIDRYTAVVEQQNKR